jgi:hypothetical protein
MIMIMIMRCTIGRSLCERRLLRPLWCCVVPLELESPWARLFHHLDDPRHLGGGEPTVGAREEPDRKDMIRHSGLKVLRAQHTIEVEERRVKHRFAVGISSSGIRLGSADTNQNQRVLVRLPVVIEDLVPRLDVLLCEVFLVPGGVGEP